MTSNTVRSAIMFAIQTQPLALRREAAAALLSISPSEFDLWVKRKIMPQPKKVGKIALWDRKKIEVAYQNLMGEVPVEYDQWDKVSL